MRNSAGALPSRAADNLIWLGRYAERCEATVRILRAYNARLAEMSNPDLPILKDTRTYLETIDVDAARADAAGPARRDRQRRAFGRARSATASRPMAGWRWPTCGKTTRNFAARVQPGDDATRAMTVLLRKLAGFSGLVHENMYRFAGWRFLEIGRRLERGIQIAGITRWLTREDAPDGALDMLLEIGDSVMTHRRRYNVAAGAELLRRPAGARPAQPALGAVPGGRAARADRAPARRPRGRPLVGGRQGRAANFTPNCASPSPRT